MKPQSNRTTQTIVASISLVVIVIAGISGVDEYRALQRSGQEVALLRADWNARQIETKKLAEIQEKISKELRDLESRTTGPAEIEAARDRLIELVRLSGARLRQLDVSNQSERAWAIAGDHPRNASINNAAEPSRYLLYTQVLELRAEGSYGTVRKLMDQIASQPWMMKTNRFSISLASGDRQNVAIEMTVTLYGLKERLTNSDELAALP